MRHGIDFSFAKYKLGACPVRFLLRRQLPTIVPKIKHGRILIAFAIEYLACLHDF